MDNVTDVTCKKFLTNMASLIFTDYRLVYKFTDKCSNDIERLKCGRLDLNNDEEPTEQGKTIECLQNKVDSLNDLCKKEIFKISTLQSEDFHLDRALYFACKDDRDQFCDTVVSGKGNTYKCLMRNKFNPLMSKPVFFRRIIG
jgi:Golgi apparatus protein 1